MMRCAVLATVVGALAMAPAAEQGKKNPVVVIDTSMGSIKVELFEDQAPVTVKNFLDYVDAKHYDDTIFHRVIKDFMVQGGGYDVNMKQKPTKAPIKNEAANGVMNTRGTIAMARTSDPDSATAQFFINSVDNAFLDKTNAQGSFGYCVFGKVIEGMDAVDAMRGVKTNADDVPQTAIVIKSIRRVEKK